MHSLFASLDAFFAKAVDIAWGIPLVVWLIGAGLFFSIVGGFVPRRLGHAIDILRGRYDDPNDPGEITHFQALSAALSATIGMGNIAGVAIAVQSGGPGAVFWMWIAGLVGMSTKFFTCTLAILYRKEDQAGVPQGGPMYFIEVGLGPAFKALSVFFALCGMIGCLGLFQVNQLSGLLSEFHGVPNWLTGVVSCAIVAVVILGGISRVGKVAARVVPTMAGIYIVGASAVIGRYIGRVPGVIATIFRQAFGSSAVAGGVAGLTFRQVLTTGVKRAAFSNEAGLGTAPMAHGAARTKEPVREGLIAMIGPLIDTNVICTLTALVILCSGVEGQAVSGDYKGAVLTAIAFEQALSVAGRNLLTIAIVLFSVSTMISYSYYSVKCAKYLAGERVGGTYVYVYLLSLPVAAIWSQNLVINLLDTAFAAMAIPTLFGALMLFNRVRTQSTDYFKRMAADREAA